jgi:glycosyltransferase involved in cell wall biosynthesis
VRATTIGGPLPVQTVLVGGSSTKIFRDAGLALPPGVRLTGYVTDAQLRALYESAACFVFPSRYEGFGLPPLEAMACGCPVIASDAASIPEVCGDAALSFDRDDPAALRAQLDRLLGDPALRAALAEAGRHRAATYTWERAARGLLDAVRGYRSPATDLEGIRCA